MIVFFAEKLPNAVRGKLKLWFIEPVPNVFVSGIADSLAEAVAEKLLESCEEESSILLVRSTREAPGYQLIQTNHVAKLTQVTNLQLVKTA